MRDVVTKMETVLGGGGVDEGGVGSGGSGSLGTASFSSTQRLFTRDKLDFSPAFMEVDFLLSRFAYF